MLVFLGIMTFILFSVYFIKVEKFSSLRKELPTLLLIALFIFILVPIEHHPFSLSFLFLENPYFKTMFMGYDKFSLGITISFLTTLVVLTRHRYFLIESTWYKLDIFNLALMGLLSVQLEVFNFISMIFIFNTVNFCFKFFKLRIFNIKRELLKHLALTFIFYAVIDGATTMQLRLLKDVGPDSLSMSALIVSCLIGLSIINGFSKSSWVTKLFFPYSLCLYLTKVGSFPIDSFQFLFIFKILFFIIGIALLAGYFFSSGLNDRQSALRELFFVSGIYLALLNESQILYYLSFSIYCFLIIFSMWFNKELEESYDKYIKTYRVNIKQDFPYQHFLILICLPLFVSCSAAVMTKFLGGVEVAMLVLIHGVFFNFVISTLVSIKFSFEFKKDYPFYSSIAFTLILLLITVVMVFVGYYDFNIKLDRFFVIFFSCLMFSIILFYSYSKWSRLLPKFRLNTKNNAVSLLYLTEPISSLYYQVRSFFRGLLIFLLENLRQVSYVLSYLKAESINSNSFAFMMFFFSCFIALFLARGVS